MTHHTDRALRALLEIDVHLYCATREATRKLIMRHSGNVGKAAAEIGVEEHELAPLLDVMGLRLWLRRPTPR